MGIRDPKILAAVLCGSLSHDTVWAVENWVKTVAASTGDSGFTMLMICNPPPLPSVPAAPMGAAPAPLPLPTLPPPPGLTESLE